jgi:hypothetical protein
VIRYFSVFDLYCGQSNQHTPATKERLGEIRRDVLPFNPMVPSMTNNRLRMLVTMCVLVIAACGKAKSPVIESAEDFATYGDLPGMRASLVPELQAELARLKTEEATPSQLTGNRPSFPTGSSSPAGVEQLRRRLHSWPMSSLQN